MKITQLVPATNTAITTLAKGIQKHNKDIQIDVLNLHPKRPGQNEINAVKSSMEKADLVDVQYWKSGAKAKELFPDLWSKKKKILTHYNPYNLHEQSWDDYLEVIVVNSFQQKELPKAKMIPLAIDLDFFKFSRQYTVDPVIHMAVNRIEGKKGVFEVAKACKELNFKLVLVGRVSSQEYLNNVLQVGGGKVDFRNSVSDDALRASYYEAAIHVCNSVDNFESGTLPVLEAMSCGIPVCSRLVGHVPDIYNGKNLHINTSPEDDVESLKKHLSEMMSGRNYRINMRLEAEKTVQDRSMPKRALAYRKLYEEFI